MIEMLVDYEQTISQLYKVFADQHPDYREFWATLAWEEDNRAGRILELKSEIEQRRATFDSANISSSGVRNSIVYIKDQAEKIHRTRIPFITALTIARDIEKSIVYGKIFNSFKGYTVKNQQMIRDLNRSVDDDYQAIESMWNEHRKYA
jgi:hypothetical protein